MKKHLLKVLGLLAISASAYAIAPGLVGPPITEGANPFGSITEVRVTANVVAGIAVNEASPIDFGNLVRGDQAYKQGEVITERTPGMVVYRADNENVQGNGSIYSFLETDMIELNWQNSNGTNPDDKGDNTKLRRVKITGLGMNGNVADPTKGEEIPLVNGQAKRILHASFLAYDKGLVTGAADFSQPKDGNLGSKQKLGSYLGSVRVHAYKK